MMVPLVTFDHDLLAPEQPVVSTPRHKRHSIGDIASMSRLYRRAKRTLHDTNLLRERVYAFCGDLPNSQLTRNAVELADDIGDYADRLADATDELYFAIQVIGECDNPNGYFANSAVVLGSPVRTRACLAVLRNFVGDYAIPKLKAGLGRQFGFEV
jgi:hypothetical protein